MEPDHSGRLHNANGAGTPVSFGVRETREKGSLPSDPQESGTSVPRPGGSPVLLRTKAIPQPRQKRGMMRWVSSKTEERKIPFSCFQRLLISWSVKGTLMKRLRDDRLAPDGHTANLVCSVL